MSSEKKLSHGSIQMIRVITISIGALLITAALFANVLGLSASSGLSGNQITFGVTGLVLIGGGILGRKFPGFYRSTALMLLNIIIAVVILEILCLALVKIIDPGRFELRAVKPEKVHAADVLQSTVVQGIYAPYVVWRTHPVVRSDILTISENGYRLVPGISGDNDAFRVFLFGGSTMWGLGVADSNTIGSYLQNQLAELSDGPVAVYNFGQPGFASTQEVIELLLQLRDGNIPDLVIFFDGVNDIWNAYGSGQAGGYHGQEQVAARVEGRSMEFEEPSIFEFVLENSNLWLLVTSLRTRIRGEEIRVEDLLTYRTMGMDKDSLALDVVNTYMGNCLVVEALAESYGFEYVLIWQPCIWVGSKTLTTDEENLALGGTEYRSNSADLSYRGLLESAYGFFEVNIPDTVHYSSFARVFDLTSERVYTDVSGAHLNPPGNEIVATEILNLVVERNLLQLK